MNLYNENDPKAAAWLRELVKQNLIPPGDVDDRSIHDIKPHELTHYTQCHFFTGVAGWPYALELAGVSVDTCVWTGSCPCQPFSVAGRGLGEADARHLWPVWLPLIAECRPPVVFGEQVASPAGREWLARVFADLEELGYAVAGADMCAAGKGSPQIRQRLFWVASAQGYERHRRLGDDNATGRGGFADSRLPAIRGLVLANGSGSQPGQSTAAHDGHRSPVESAGGDVFGVGSTIGSRPEMARHSEHDSTSETERQAARAGSAGSNSPWREYDICHFTDGKQRRIEPGTFPLANGVPARVVRLRGYGNAIVPEVAAEFVKAYCEVTVETEDL